LSQFSDYYFFHNLFQKAALYQKQYITLKDSLMGNELTQNMAAIQSEYEQRTHQAAISQKDALLQQERYQVYAVGFIALLIIVVIFILIRIYLLKLNHVQQKKLGMVEVQATERERENLAKELHDGVGTDLIAIKLRVMGVLNQHTIDANTSQEVEEQFQSITKTVKNISYGLTPPGLDRFGLFSALSNYFTKINESADVAIHFNNSGADHQKGPVTITIFRVLQELISNSLKHAVAKNIRITIESFDDLINILFEDDGKGFSPSAVKRGLGLYNVESRVKSLGGTIALESGPIGTFFSIDIPLNK
jgi:signal transduction histidine kinase